MKHENNYPGKNDANNQIVSLSSGLFREMVLTLCLQLEECKATHFKEIKTKKQNVSYQLTRKY